MSPRRTWIAIGLAGAAAAAAALIAPAGVQLQAGLIVLCLGLWLGESVPPFGPTLLLLAVAPLVLTDRGATPAVKTVLGWAADPVLALFFGGLAAAAAARKHRLDERVARWLILKSGGSPRALVALLMAGTALLSMWMSNVAAAAMMIGAARPALDKLGGDDAKHAGLVGLAMAANLAGMSTPVGSGPNGIAIAAIADRAEVTFLGWVAFGVPLAAGLVVLAYLLVRSRIPTRRVDIDAPAPMPRTTGAARLTVGLLLAAVVLWLAEPLTGIPSAVVSLGLAASLFMLGPLGAADLERIDWSTLLLIAGGILLGRLTETTGLLELATSWMQGSGLGLVAVRVILCVTAATLSALMSNTATAALLVPIAVKLDPSPAGVVLVAVATSLGVPFVVSTPPNAMVVGEGVPGRDLLRVGLPIMVGGVLVVAITGPHALSLFGLR